MKKTFFGIRLILVVSLGFLALIGCREKKKKAVIWPVLLLGNTSVPASDSSTTGSTPTSTTGSTPTSTNGSSSTGTGTSLGVDTSFLNFDKEGVTYESVSFGGTTSTIEAGPSGGNGLAVKVIKGNSGGGSSEIWGGTTVSTTGNPRHSIEPIPLSSTSNIVTVLVHSPTIGTRIRLKFEDANDPTHCVETDAFTTEVGWQTMTFDFNNHATGTAALNQTYTFNRVSIFMDFGNRGTGQVYYCDDFKFPVK